MKNKIFILMMLISFYASSQEKLEGLWASTDDIWFKAISYNDYGLKLNNWSFLTKSHTEEKLLKFDKTSFNTHAKNLDNNWIVKVNYTLLNDSVLKANFTGSTTNTIYLYKINLPKLPLNVE